MRFLVTRTSEWDTNKAPCLKAEFENGEWFIEIESISSLLDFTRTHEGRIIITSTDGTLTPAIEIYDWYRE